MSTIKQPRITPFLWFEAHAEAAIAHYTSIFPNSSIELLNKWPEGGPFPSHTVQTAIFYLDGVKFYAFDAGPQFKFNEAISLYVHCANQEEVDHYWSKLSEGGIEQPCGWVKDQFGLSWQIVPDLIGEKMAAGEPARLQNMMMALGQMKKLEIAALEAAYNAPLA